MSQDTISLDNMTFLNVFGQDVSKKISLDQMSTDTMPQDFTSQDMTF